MRMLRNLALMGLILAFAIPGVSYLLGSNTSNATETRRTTLEKFENVDLQSGQLRQCGTDTSGRYYILCYQVTICDEQGCFSYLECYLLPLRADGAYELGDRFEGKPETCTAAEPPEDFRLVSPNAPEQIPNISLDYDLSPLEGEEDRMMLCIEVCIDHTDSPDGPHYDCWWECFIVGKQEGNVRLGDQLDSRSKATTCGNPPERPTLDPAGFTSLLGEDMVLPR